MRVACARENLARLMPAVGPLTWQLALLYRCTVLDLTAQKCTVLYCSGWCVNEGAQWGFWVVWESFCMCGFCVQAMFSTVPFTASATCNLCSYCAASATLVVMSTVLGTPSVLFKHTLTMTKNVRGCRASHLHTHSARTRSCGTQEIPDELSTLADPLLH